MAVTETFVERVSKAIRDTGSFGTRKRPAEDEQRRVIPGAVVTELILGSSGIHLHGVVIDGDVDLSYREWRGELDLSHCRLNGALRLEHATLKGRVQLDGAYVREISAEYADIEGPLRFIDGHLARGLYGLGMRVSGSLNLRRTEVWAPEDKPNRCAIELFRARLGDVFFTGARLFGGLYANGITVDRNVRLQEATIESRQALGWRTGVDSSAGAVSLVGATINSALYLSRRDPGAPPWQVKGAVELTRVSCVTLRVRKSELDGIPLKLDHFTYVRLAGIEPLEWLAVLEQTTGVPNQPYVHLAELCADLGRTDWQRRVQIALQRRATSELPPRSHERWRRRVWQWSVEYGYRPGRAIGWLALCTLLCVLTVLVGGDFLVQELDGEEARRGVESGASAVAIAMDNVLPFAGLGVARQWYADPTTAAQVVWLTVFVVIKFAGWGMAAVGLASVTGVLKRP